MTERDIKLLWGRSGNRCAICRTELSQDKKLASEKYPLGEQAHIVGERKAAPRGESNLSDDERDGYSNRILLCPNHHTEVDKDESYYSVERLHLIKQTHELWVQGKLSEQTDVREQANELVYSSLIDCTVKFCSFQIWNSWVRAAGNSRPCWRESVVNGVEQFEDCIFRAAWPKTRPELERALTTLSGALGKARDTFMRHSEYGQRLGEGVFETIPFYKLIWHEDQSVYERLLSKYNDWELECFFWLWISTKAANWLSDVVRRDINPMFFAVEGRFVFDGGIDQCSGRVPEFSEEEKKILPDGIANLFKEYSSKLRKSEE
jgi:hypothetical protein